MEKSVEQIVEDYKRASAKLRREIGNDPVKSRAFLERAGILKPLSNDASEMKDAPSPVESPAH